MKSQKYYNKYLLRKNKEILELPAIKEQLEEIDKFMKNINIQAHIDYMLKDIDLDKIYKIAVEPSIKKIKKISKIISSICYGCNNDNNLPLKEKLTYLENTLNEIKKLSKSYKSKLTNKLLDDIILNIEGLIIDTDNILKGITEEKRITPAKSFFRELQKTNLNYLFSDVYFLLLESIDEFLKAIDIIDYIRNVLVKNRNNTNKLILNVDEKDLIKIKKFVEIKQDNKTKLQSNIIIKSVIKDLKLNERLFYFLLFGNDKDAKDNIRKAKYISIKDLIQNF